MSLILGWVGLFLAAALAGAINAVAGGGTLVSFPALVAYGQPAIFANATNTAAIWTGSVSSALAYRRDTDIRRDLFLALFLPSLIGSLLGAVVLVITPPELFARVVPFLVLFATLLFALKDVLTRLVRGHSAHPHENVTAGGMVWGILFQLFVAAYGGYFGAGIGILMLGSFALMGLVDIHRMNALKTMLGSTINVVAFFYLALRGLVVWRLAALMAVGAILGGWIGARTAKRIDQERLRVFIVAVGLLVSIWLFVRR